MKALTFQGVREVAVTEAPDPPIVEPHLAFSPGEAYEKSLTDRAGRSPARRQLELAAKSGVDRLVSHRIPLADAAHGYHIFDGATKVLLEPWWCERPLHTTGNRVTHLRRRG